MPDNLMGFVELRSSWARHGLSMPPTIIDAGFKGDITLEVINHSTHNIALKPGVRFAHIIFAATMNRVKNTYSGKYLGQRGIRTPKLL
jgi:dCTP deaminase